MIVIIADDFSGAAEVAGAAYSHGLSVAVCTSVADCKSDVLVIDTATRSLAPERAAARVAGIAAQVAELQPSWVYKKVDSVLRGPVVAEIEAIAQVLHYRAALLVSANPKRNRCVFDGQVWIEGRLLHETEFAGDPDYPARSASVLELLGPSRAEKNLVNPSDSLQRSGLMIGNASSSNDLIAYAEHVPENLLLAGGMEFFEAILSRRSGVLARNTANGLNVEGPTLIACGSVASWQQRRALCMQYEVPIIELASDPKDNRNSEGSESSVALRVGNALSQRGIAMLTIGSTLQPKNEEDPKTAHFARIVQEILDGYAVSQLLVEGGCSASAIVRHCGWSQLKVVDCFAPGVVGLRSLPNSSPLLVVKPGSYPWPESVWSTAANNSPKSPKARD